MVGPSSKVRLFLSSYRSCGYSHTTMFPFGMTFQNNHWITQVLEQQIIFRAGSLTQLKMMQMVSPHRAFSGTSFLWQLLFSIACIELSGYEIAVKENCQLFILSFMCCHIIQLRGSIQSLNVTQPCQSFQGRSVAFRNSGLNYCTNLTMWAQPGQPHSKMSGVSICQ